MLGDCGRTLGLDFLILKPPVEFPISIGLVLLELLVILLISATRVGAVEGDSQCTRRSYEGGEYFWILPAHGRLPQQRAQRKPSESVLRNQNRRDVAMPLLSAWN